MTAIVKQNGQRYEMPLTMCCQNPKCEGEYELKQEFPNGQELWVCAVCKHRWFSYTANAKYAYASARAANLAAADELETDCTHLFSSEAMMKECAYCRQDFVTYNPEEDICEQCSVANAIGWRN